MSAVSEQRGVGVPRMALSKPGQNRAATPQADAWVVPLRAEGSRPPLFCVCAGGGDVFDYDDLAQALPADQPVYVFGLPPSVTAEGFPTVQQLAAIYVQQACKLQPHGPYRLCGHSFGGLVVYEMARLLAGAGERVGLLALIDTLHPAFKRDMSAGERLRFQATYIADRIRKYVHNLASLRLDRIGRDLGEFVYYRCKRLAWTLLRSVFTRLGRPAPSAIRSHEMLLFTAWRNYVPASYPGRLVLLNAIERTAEFARDNTLGWKACVTGSIDVHTVPGDHFSIMHPPQVHELVARLSPYLGRP